jgi:AraC-like DNA-binding protein
MAFVPPARHLLRARDLVDARYAEDLGVDDLAAAAGLSRALLRNTDHPVAEVCFSVGLRSVGSFTTSFKRTFGKSPTAYRASFPPASAQAVVPACMVRVYGRPALDEGTAKEIENLMGKGYAGTVFLTTEDCRASYEELKARGVEFAEAPEERPYGIDTGSGTRPETACA